MYLVTNTNNRKSKRKMEAAEFIEQIREDISIIQEDQIKSDNKLKDEDYAFNYWVLNKMYNVDDDIIFNYILEGNDRGIDCYYHYKDSKQLFLIQNKFYSDDTALTTKEVSHFLKTSLSLLKAGNYKRSPALNDLFAEIKDDPEYQISFHLYITNDKKYEEIETIFSEFNLENKTKSGFALIHGKIFKRKDIIDAYYGKQYNDSKSFDFDLTSNVGGMILSITPENKEYKLPSGFLKAYYMMVPIKYLFEMYQMSVKHNYGLFAENIREYLGTTPINEAIKKTLEGEPEERINFFYYNNGITIICDKTGTPTTFKDGTKITLTKPSIVNGCQTVSTIYEVLSNYVKKDQSLAEFKDVYVMVKILAKNAKIAEKNPEIYENIVKYTNKQNALTEKAFAADHTLFNNIQKAFRDRGFLLAIKPGNVVTFKKEGKDNPKSFNELRNKANIRTKKFGLELKTTNDLIIPIEKLLQVYLAVVKDGYYAYTSKAELLQKNSSYYKDYSLNIPDFFSHDSLLDIWLLYKKAETEKKKSEDKLPIPFYVLGFLGSFIDDKNSPSAIKNFIANFFNQSISDLGAQYSFLSNLTKIYRASNKRDYNDMIKNPIDRDLLESKIRDLSILGSDSSINQIKSLNNK